LSVPKAQSKPIVADRLEQTPKLVSIIIPALHRPDLTARCLQSLVQQTIPANDYEVVVVENDARPDSILKDPLPPNVRRILLKQNYGTTASINFGIAASSSKYVLLLNNDVEVQPQFLTTLVNAMEGDQNCAFTTGKLLRATDRTRIDGAGDALLLGGGAYRLGHADPDTAQFETRRWILGGCGAATLFRRSVLEETHGLDADFFAYLDDIELALCAHQLGYKGCYIPEAVAYHVGSATLGDPMHPKVIELITRNQLYLIAKHYPSGVLWTLLPRILFFQLLWFAFIIRHQHLRAYLSGVLTAAMSIRRSLRKRTRVMRQRRIDNRHFLQLLCASEKQLFEWHTSRPHQSRSDLLTAYFRVFNPFSDPSLS
jgi:GT2 family glycosyltransferase